ncbi:hypothetical protein B0I72DRAFT_141923 [Yarrowia lipolytica]|uniref:YALI0F32043p n=2 Tax=Yarrowia lipolytica TaxID=4952 RepID=Q6BZP3_YARLI|nr:YALI0F32043p [Yarrowia lipolytica CLIB122]AOW07983.1 hypothetical protein YALI1_F39665g [Yarrowia lipolytica]KAB8280076.1 hypothetical protein BKA91DRAFT_142548 [Yarrowia lipolytica]KAE8170558.1 hypothetical protein BKA90DRAFT_140672 [Yarrowia lipolytica]KAJ8054985.1 hypothetical protein LXG23DRAFT_19620 [Yarrowia lipolytica]QNP99551.1 GTPase-activating protein BEM2 [Yarrowia lipolytica]|eukprot:XP_506119.2 YALI0F32043p [Yarrowia lipolytica CLIB122]
MGWGKKSSSSAVPKPPAQPPKSPAKPPSSSASQPSSRDPAIVPRADCKKNYYYQQMLHRQLNDDGSTDNLATRNSFSSSENKTIREDIRMGDQEVLRDIRELKSAGSNVRRSRSPQLRPPSVHQRLPSDDSMSNSTDYYVEPLNSPLPSISTSDTSLTASTAFSRDHPSVVNSKAAVASVKSAKSDISMRSTSKSVERNPFTGVITTKHDMEHEGWLNNSLTPGAQWRLSRGVVRNGQLLVYKPPSDLSNRFLDPDAPRTQPSSTHTAISAPFNAAPVSDGMLSHASAEPHPSLELDSSGTRIMGGTVEAVCHQLLFGDDDLLAESIVYVLPLFTDVVYALDKMCEYIIGPVRDSRSSLARYQERAVARAAMAVRKIQDDFSGMLLETSICSALLKLIDGIGALSDQVSTDLKVSVFKKQRHMGDLLTPSREGTLWSVQPKLPESVNERLQSFLVFTEQQNQLGAMQSSSASSSSSHSSQFGSSSSPQTFPPDLFLDTSIDLLASQVYYFHLQFSGAWSPASDMSLLFGGRWNYWRHNPLIFDSLSVHFLGGVLLEHLFSGSGAVSSAYRGKLLSHWISLGNALKNCGDMVGWLGIAGVVCSPPVLRLRDSWGFVSTEIKDSVTKEWAPVVFDLERRLRVTDMSRKSTYHVLAPQGIGQSYPKERVVPFFGDLCVRYEDGSSFRQCESRLNRIRTAFERWQTYLDQVPQIDTFDSAAEPISALQRMLYYLLNRHSQGNIPFHVSNKEPISALLKMSLQCEPSSSGRYLPHFYNQQLPLLMGSFVPTVFTDVTPSYRLFSKTDLLTFAGFGSPTKRSGTGISSPLRSLPSGTSGTEVDQFARRYVSQFSTQHPLICSLRDIMNVGSSMIQGDDVLLKVVSEGPEGSDPTVVVKAASLDRLIDILILGVGHFAPRVKMDMDLYTLTFFATFRSFCSPTQLLDAFRRRFVGAQSGSTSLTMPRTFDQKFPDWDSTHIPEKQPDYRLMAQIQIGILEACFLWVSQYFIDFVNEYAVRELFLDFLATLEVEISRWGSVVFNSEDIVLYRESLEGLHKKLRKLFIKKSYRPVSAPPKIPYFGPSSKYIQMPINCGISDVESWISEVDLMAAHIFALVPLKDWMSLYETLEVQGVEPLGFFAFRTPSMATEDEVIVQSVYTYFETLFRDKPEDRVLLNLPFAVQELLRLHNNFVSYLTAQLTDLSIRPEIRVARMETLLKGIGICRRRMKAARVFEMSPMADPEEGPPPLSPSVAPAIPSFVEVALAAAAIRPESRLFTGSWFAAAKECGSSTADSLESIIPYVDGQLQNKPLTPCVGWLIERMLEASCHVPNMCVETPKLINFDKRRYAYNLVGNVCDIRPLDEQQDMNLPEQTKRMSFLINLSKASFAIDRKVTKEHAAREAKAYGKSKNRVFTHCVGAELEKIKRDVRQREVLDRKRQHAVRAPTSSSNSEKRGKSRLGGFLKAVRPISMALGSSWTPPQSQEASGINPLDLPTFSVDKVKPFRSIPLGHSDIFPVHALSKSMFKIVDSSGEYSFQAASEADSEIWLKALTRAKNSAPQTSQSTRQMGRVFGVPVAVVCEREQAAIPYICEVLLNEIEARGLDEVGLYRISGSLNNVNALKQAFDNGERPDMNDDRWYDVNTLAGCFKLYLREMPEPLLPLELLPDFVSSTTGPQPDLAGLRAAADRMPAPNLNLLRRLVQHLSLVTTHGEQNRMHAVNLAIVFSMSLLPPNASANVSTDLSSMQTVLKLLIIHCDGVFGSLDGGSTTVVDGASTPSSGQLEAPDMASLTLSESKSTSTVDSLEMMQAPTSRRRQPAGQNPNRRFSVLNEGTNFSDLAHQFGSQESLH